MKMNFPLELSDFSLWLAINAIVLLITSEMLSAHFGDANIYVNKKRLRNVTLVVSMLFLVIVAITIISKIL